MSIDRILIPNSFQTPNAFVETRFEKRVEPSVMAQLSGGAFKVLIFIARKTYGFHLDSESIGLGELTKFTGLSRQGVLNGIDELSRFGLVNIQRGPRNSQIANKYSLNIDITTGKLVQQLDQSKKLTSQKTNVGLVKKVDSLKLIRETHKRGRAKAAPDPAVNEFKKFWDGEYTKRFLTPYQFNHGKDGSLITEWLRTSDLGQLQARAVKFFDSDDEWIQTKGGFTLGVFAGQINKLNSTGRIQPSARREMPA